VDGKAKTDIISYDEDQDADGLNAQINRNPRIQNADLISVPTLGSI
jgi:hypothetical protein